MFTCVTLNINEPINLARSVLLISWVLIFAFFKPHFLNFKSRWLLLILLIPFFYFLSATANHQNFILALTGNYNRNFGLLTLIAVGVLVINVANGLSSTREFLVWALLPVVLMSLVYGLIQYFQKDPITWLETDRTVLTLGNSDYAAALLGVLLIVPAYLFFHFKNKIFKALMIIPFLLIVRIGLYSQAYQFRVLGAFSVIIFLSVFFWPKIQQVSRLIRVTTVAALGSGVMFFIISNRTELISRTSFIDRISQQSMGLRMFSDYPVFGVGVDQFWRFIPKYLQPSDIQRNGSLVVPDKTHNLIIDHLAMGGILVGLAFTVFLVYSLVITYKLNKLGTELRNRSEFALLSGIWVTYVIHLFISTDNLFMMIFGYASFGLIAQTYYANYPTKSKEGKLATKARALSPNAIRICAALLLVAVSVVNIKALMADAKIKKIVTNQVQSGDEIIQTLRSFPNPKTAEQVIVYLLQNLQNCPVALVASDDLLKLDNRSAQAWYFKTLCSDAANDQKTALTYLKKAIDLQPMNLIYLDARVRLEVRLKDLTAASETLERIRTINPDYESIKNLEELVTSQVTS